MPTQGTTLYARTGTEEAQIVESQQPTDGNARTEAPTAEPRAEAAAAAEPAAEANHLDGAKDIARAGQGTAAEQLAGPAEVLTPHTCCHLDACYLPLSPTDSGVPLPMHAEWLIVFATLLALVS